MDFVFQSKNIGIFFERYLKSQFMSIQIKSVNFLTEILQPFQSTSPVSQLDFLLEIWNPGGGRLHVSEKYLVFSNFDIDVFTTVSHHLQALLTTFRTVVWKDINISFEDP